MEFVVAEKQEFRHWRTRKEVLDSHKAIHFKAGEGKAEGKVETIHTLQEILLLPVIPAEVLQAMNLEQLDALIAQLRQQFHHRDT